MGRRHVSWNEDSARKDYEVPEPSAPTRSPVKKTTTYQVARSCGVPKLRSLHQAPLTPPHMLCDPCYAGIASAHSENRADSFLSGVSTLRDHHQRFATRHLSTASVPAKPAVLVIIRHRSAHQMTVSSLHYSTCHLGTATVNRQVCSLARPLVTKRKVQGVEFTRIGTSSDS